MNNSKNKLNSEIIIILIVIQTHTQATRVTLLNGLLQAQLVSNYPKLILTSLPFSSIKFHRAMSSLVSFSNGPGFLQV